MRGVSDTTHGKGTSLSSVGPDTWQRFVMTPTNDSRQSGCLLVDFR
jgi:hypothetical protein